VSDAAPAPAPPGETHDPIPESNWFWRRVFVFAACTMVCIGVWGMVITMVHLAGDHAELIVGAFVRIIGWLLLFAWFAMTYYIVGTNGEQVVRIVQTASMFKSGLSQTMAQQAAPTLPPPPAPPPGQPGTPQMAGQPVSPPWH